MLWLGCPWWDEALPQFPAKVPSNVQPRTACLLSRIPQIPIPRSQSRTFRFRPRALENKQCSLDMVISSVSVVAFSIFGLRKVVFHGCDFRIWQHFDLIDRFQSFIAKRKKYKLQWLLISCTSTFYFILMKNRTRAYWAFVVRT